MAHNNKDKALRNAITSLLYQLIAIVYGLIIPRIILGAFGSEINGLVSSITQFLNYITLLEGGLTGVVMAALYKPLVNKDNEKISSIVKAADMFFKRVAVIFVLYSCFVAIIYPNIVQTPYSFRFVSTLVLIIALSLFIQYFFSLTYRILISADQNGYVVFLAQIIFTILNFLLTIIIVNFYPEIHVLKICNAIAFLIQPIVFRTYVHKNYKINKNAIADKTAISQRWDGFGQNIAYFIHTNTDIVILTMFCTLVDVSVYSIYFLVANSLKMLVTSISSAVVPTIGHVFVSGDQIQKEKIFDKYEFLIYSITVFLFTCGCILVTPFVSVYTKGINDADYYRPLFGVLMMTAECIYCLRDPYVSVAYAMGHFKQTAKYAYAEAILNIMISIILVYKFGIIGVAVGTLISMLYRMIMQIIYLKNNILYRPVRKWLRIICSYGCVSMVCCLVLNKYIIARPETFIQWLKCAIITTATVSAVLCIMVFVMYRNLTEAIIKKGSIKNE